MRETKIIAAGANPALLGYVSGICLHKGALEGVSRMWQQRGDSNIPLTHLSRQRWLGRGTRAERACSSLKDPFRNSQKRKVSPACLHSSRETPAQGNATVPPTHIPGGNGSGQGMGPGQAEITVMIWRGFGLFFLPFTF